MTRYFMHLRNDSEELLDPDGQEFRSLSAMRDAVLMTARDLLMGDVRDGVMDLRLRIDATDDCGTIVHSLPFARAVKIIAANSAS